MKAPNDVIGSVRTSMSRFHAVCNCTFQEEIAKYNKEAAEKNKKEMKEMYQKIQNDHSKTIEKLEENLERMIQEEKERKERSKKRAYNPRYAEKTCWHCGI